MPTITPLARDNTFRAGFSEFKEVSYNGVKFPPAINATGSYEPVYDDSGRLMKYVRGKLHIEAYLFPGCLDPVVSNVIPYHAPVAPYGVGIVTSGGFDVTTDTTMNSIRDNLSTPCAHLRFEAQGFGSINLNDSVSGSNFDVDNGPKPKMISWTPLTNKMAKVVWECEFTFSPCYSDGHFPSYFAQFPFSVSIHTGPAGLTTRTITGKFETALTRIHERSQEYSMKDQEQLVLSFFPVMKQFRRDQNFKFGMDRKTLEFTITDTEINSDDAFAPGCENEEVELSISGALNPGGFRRWAVSLSGSIDLMAGVQKVVAYDEITRLFDHYFRQLAYSGQSPAGDVTPSWIEGLEILKERSPFGTSFPILRDVKLTDHIFGRSINFSFHWDLFVNLSTLFKATGLFIPIESSPGGRNRDWTKWKASVETILNAGGYQELGFTQDNDIIVSLCQPLIGKPYPLFPIPGPDKKTKPKKEKPDAKDTTSDPDQTNKYDLYSMFESWFEHEEDSGTVYHTPLTTSSPVQEKLIANLSRKKTSTYQLPTPSSSSSSSIPPPKVLVHKLRPSTHIIVFKGVAIRLGFPVPYANASMHGDKSLLKIGTDLHKPFKVGNGVDVATGKNYSIHGLLWEKRYIVSNTPNNTNTVSDGHSIAFPG